MLHNKKNTIGFHAGVILFIMTTFSGYGFASSYTASSYYSLYQAARYYTYKDASGTTINQVRVGYEYQNNLDSISRCYNLSCTLPTSYDVATFDSTGKTMFKVYVAPGTTGINLTSNCSDNFGKFVFVARLGTPPGDYSSYANSLTSTAFISLPEYNGFTLSQLSAGDCIGRNSVGYIFIAGDAGLNLGSSDGGWLYVQIIPLTAGKSVSYTSFDDTVDTASYLSWYNTVDWSSFAAEDGQEYFTGGTIGTVTATPTPTPVTTPTPTPVTTPTPTPVTTPTPTPVTTPTPTPVTVPTPTPTPASGGCILFGIDMCAARGGTCVSGTCVMPTPTPSPTATPVVTPSPTPTSTPKPTPSPTPVATPTPSPTPTSQTFTFTAAPLSSITVQSVSCTGIELKNMVAVLNVDTPPTGNVSFYSAVTSSGTPIWYFSQPDIWNNNVFTLLDSSGGIKKQASGPFPASGSWSNEAFGQLFSLAPSSVSYTCSDVANAGLVYLFGFAPGGDISQFQGAAFTFTP